MEVRQGKMSLVAKGPSYSMGHGGEPPPETSSKRTHRDQWTQWAQLLTAACYAIWAMGLTHLKWSIGYLQLPVFGIIPVPWQLWTSHQMWLNNIYCAFLCTAFCLYGKQIAHLPVLD